LRDEHPDALLKSALEKIVYFEARSQQLYTDLAAAQAKIDRLKDELGASAQREIELRRELAEHQVEVNRSRKERDELDKLNDALRAERAALLGKLIEAARIHDSDKPPEDGESPFDLASFISELRSEAIAPKAAPNLSRPAPAHSNGSPPSTPAKAAAEKNAPASAVAQHAARLRSEGRLAVSKEQVLELSTSPPFAGTTEETLFGFSVRELSSPEPEARKRAAERLKALGNPAAGAALASALHAEANADVQVALLGAFAGLAQSEGVPIIAPHLRAPVPEVRIAALKALIALDPAQAGPYVAAAIKDGDRAVRRRASLLALGLSGSAALKLGEQAILDEEPEVRSLAALVLGASNGDRARSLLLEALADRDPKVRDAAAQSLSRILGKEVSPMSELDDSQRRREVRRLAALPVQAESDRRSKALVKGYFTFATQLPSPEQEQVHRERAPLVPATPVPAPELLCTAIMSEIRCALRGCSLSELAATNRCPPDTAQEACELLVARGQVVRRGLKYFAA
jgi:HEAT repeat protein